MMIRVRARNGGDPYHLNVNMIESIIEREGNTSEIRLTNGRVYSSIESPDQLSNRVSFMLMSSELNTPKEGGLTPRALDVCPVCRGGGIVRVGVYAETCGTCNGTGTRQ